VGPRACQNMVVKRKIPAPSMNWTLVIQFRTPFTFEMYIKFSYEWVHNLRKWQ
jgi:hypothetical protein